MVKIYIVNEWQSKIDINKPRNEWSIELVKIILGNIDIQKEDSGKSFLKNDNRYINWSHNEKYLVLAVSNIGNVGIDIEQTDIHYDENLYGWVLHDEEKNKIKNGTLFSEVWTRKEAVLKYSGEGINDNMFELNTYCNKQGFLSSFNLEEISISVCSQYNEEIEMLVYN